MIKYADVSRPEIRNLKSAVMESHYLPEDILENPTAVLVYFLPFIPETAKSNIAGESASPEWAKAYQETDRLSEALNVRLVEMITGLGYRAAAPADAGSFSDDILKSRWSHRHIAQAAGLGTFGINRMLITENGCCGRYYSVVTDLPVETDRPSAEEFCSYKKD